MAWTAGADVTTGDLITAAQWNSYLGAAGSLDYLKTEVDKLDDISMSTPANALDTIYQNSTKLRFVLVTVLVIQNEYAKVLVGSGTPPGTQIARAAVDNLDAGDTAVIPVGFFVNPSWYYEVESFAGTPDLEEWAEWDLH